MNKPANLPAKTDKDHDYLVSRGWRFIGSRRAKYGRHFYWDYFEDGCWSKAFIQGDATVRQKRLDKLAALTESLNPTPEREPNPKSALSSAPKYKGEE